MPVTTRWCPKCRAHTLVSGSTCSFCSSKLGQLPPAAPTPIPELQRALEATILFHLTEPRGATT